MVILPHIRRKYMVSRLPAGSTVDMAECVVTLASDSVPYTGSARTVGVTVTWGGAALAVNTDYTLAFANNVNVGAATVTVTGMGQFAGSVTKTFYITSGAIVGWDGIDLAHATDTGNSAALAGVSELYHLQTLPDGRLFTIDAVTHNMYIWGFGASHPFEVTHFKAEPDSVSEVVSNAQMGALTGDGLIVAYSQTSWGYFWTRPLSTAFDLSVLGSQTEKRLTGANNLRIYISRNGMNVAVFPRGGNTLRVYSMETPNDFAGMIAVSGINMSNVIQSVGNWRDFVFSEDGKVLVLVADGTVYKIDLETPWDLSGAEVHSSFTPAGLTGYIEGIAVSNDATKMILFSTGDGKFHEYNLA